jgi:CRP-like cAMP-binding protein
MPVSVAPPVAIHQPSPSTPPADHYAHLVRRIQGEYQEMPGLRLTFAQACRLWGLDRSTCSRVLDNLVAAGFVVVSERGLYVRRTTA